MFPPVFKIQRYSIFQVEYPELVFVNQDLESQDVDPDKVNIVLNLLHWNS